MKSENGQTNILLVGVGGQGIITTGKLLGKAAVKAGIGVYVSETRGLSKRRGPVVCAVRMGSVSGPLMFSGSADAILSSEPLEALRNISYARKNAKVITDINPVIPFSVAAGHETYPALNTILEKIRPQAKLYVIDSLKVARKIGSPLVRNIIMLGALASADILPFTPDVLLETILSSFDLKYRKINIEAFEQGKKSLFGK